jgi:hypothetical protein
MLKLSWIDQPKTAPIGGSLILSTISALAMGCGSIAAQKAQEKQDPESNSSTLSQSSAQAQSAKDSKNEFKGTIRSVRPNDWACLAWTVADVTMPNSIWDNILKREPKVLEGSHLITMKSSKFFVDYSNDPITAGKGYNGAWGDCPGFSIVSKEKSGDLSNGPFQLRSNLVHTAGDFDGNGQKMIPHQTKNYFCATAVEGRVVMNLCDSQNPNQDWLWDQGKNSGYGYMKLARDTSLCMDVPNSGSGVSQGRPMILYRCKPFIAGPGGDSNNQRFWLDETSGP